MSSQLIIVEILSTLEALRLFDKPFLILGIEQPSHECS